MPRGRKPKPRHLKVLDGNPGKRALKPEPRPTPKVPSVPTWMSKEAKAEWKRIVPELDKVGLLTLVDRGALAVYCEAWSTFQAASADVNKNGLTIEVERQRFSRNGDLLSTDTILVRNPAIQTAKDSTGIIKAFATEFGLTPFSRSRLTAPEPDEDELEAILNPKRSSRGSKE